MSASPTTHLPPLESGDRLTRKEFELRYQAMPHLKKAELIEGEGCQVKVSASTPAVVWTSSLPQEQGIHVHVYKNSNKIIDDTFGQVTWFDGSSIERHKLLELMLEKPLKGN